MSVWPALHQERTEEWLGEFTWRDMGLELVADLDTGYQGQGRPWELAPPSMLHPRQLSCLTLPQLCLILADQEDAIPFWGEKAQKTWFEEGENKLSLCLLLLMVTGYRRFFQLHFLIFCCVCYYGCPTFFPIGHLRPAPPPPSGHPHM